MMRALRWILGRQELLLFVCIFFLSCSQQQKQPVAFVDPFIDSHKSRWFYFNSASRPFGMVNLSPDTRTEGSWNSGYLYDSLQIRCFSHIHAWQMSGIPVMPTTGPFEGHLGMEHTKSQFSHESEIAQPGYHKVVLDKYGIKAELSSTTRVGMHRYTFPATDSAYIAFHTGAMLGHGGVDSSGVRKVSEQEIEGFALMTGTFRRPKSTYVYFVATFDRPFQEFGGWQDSTLLPHTEPISGKNNGAYVRFHTGQEPVQMKVGISYTSIENARKNLEGELPHWDFDRVVNESRKEWNTMLSRIRVEGGSEPQRTKFYTDLWRSLLGRRIVSDLNGEYCDMTGPQPLIKRVRLDDNGKPLYPQYQFDAWWGSHWTLNVLWSMVYPEVMEGFCNSMVNMYNDGGLIPRGPSGGNYTYVMIGDPAVSFFATAYHKGIRNYEVEKAYEGLRKNAFPGGIRDRAGYDHSEIPISGGMREYVERGYVPERLEGEGIHKDGASMTLEYAYQDWCLAQLAKALGKPEDYALFTKRSQNYRHLWNPESGFIHPREKDGTWIVDFAPIGKGFNTLGFCESNAAIYTHFVPHDLPGLIALAGGNEKYVQMVESSFLKSEKHKFVTDHGKHAESWIDYENQPSCHMAHLFNYADAPWLSQKWVRKVKEVTFGDTSPYGGYNGDEDQGQMGALGVLMALGLFQMDGGASANSKYDITSPLFDRIEIILHPEYYEGEKFIITTQNNSKENLYIQSAQLNGKVWNACYFTHDTFAKGGTLALVLGAQPNKNWGRQEASDQQKTVSK
ncbi:GH92 family glycosyl hydrolase [Rapidithrix thailandica]|uniref:GH92 family glycosyl hydrolase n=1 Tax=Rapidithrix thailandica TaxID=413964 RepID=A0AAW9SJ51_9BACT